MSESPRQQPQWRRRQLRHRAAIALAAVLTVLPTMATADSPSPELSYTRLMRRITTRLLGRPPTTAEYSALLEAQNDTVREALIQGAIADALDSQAFYDRMVAFGHDYMGVGQYTDQWSISAHLDVCPEDSLHAGKFGTFRTFEQYPSYGDSFNLCNETGGSCGAGNSCPGGFTCDTTSQECVPSACSMDSDCSSAYRCDLSSNLCTVLTAEVEPWWAPGTTLETIGWAGQGHQTVPDHDNPGQQ